MPHRCPLDSPPRRNASSARSALFQSMSRDTSSATQPLYLPKDLYQPTDPKFHPTGQARRAFVPFPVYDAWTPTGCRQSASSNWRSPHHYAGRSYPAVTPARKFPALDRRRSKHHIPTFAGTAKCRFGVAQSNRLAPTQPRHRMHLHPDARV